ncbi:MAG TPA: recombinase family protein [Candidatus Nitrosotalea sp.]|nr:recombinase family protein [Candidatus Nitrosotalea sp.]
MRVATYTRISTDEEHQPYSLEAQETRLAAYIASQDGWELTRRYTDRMTGSTLERPELQRALADARVERFDLLLVYRVDRLSRSVRGLAQILEELDHSHVVFRSATEPFDTGTPAGRMMVQMLGVFAEFERATLVDRVIAGMERKAATGGWLGGPNPYGYRYNPAIAMLEPDECEVATVRAIFDLYVTKKLGTRAVANWLNSHGHQTRAGRPWSAVTVFDILRNPVHVGRIKFRSASYQAPHVALVSQDAFDAAQTMLTARADAAWKRRSNTSDYLLSGVVRCGKCGNRFLGTVAHGRNGPYRYYTCFSRNRYGRHGCQADRLPADAFERAVLASMQTTYSDSDLIERAVAGARKKVNTALPRMRSDLRSLEAKIDKAEQALLRYFDAFESGTLAARRLAGRMEELEQRLAELRMQRETLQDELADISITPPTASDLRSVIGAIADAMDNGMPSQRKALMQQLVSEIRVESRSEIFPTYRLPAPPVRVISGVVGRGGLEPPTSALTKPVRCGSESGDRCAVRGCYVVCPSRLGWRWPYFLPITSTVWQPLVRRATKSNAGSRRRSSMASL